MRAYYNEKDPHAAAWLRSLIVAGLIMDGEVDERNIVDVSPDDLSGFGRVHFFAGIGGWDYALQLAGWPVDRPVWTGSCPCQPFSAAGKRKGVDDERHLWPEFARLIAACKPATVFGEQVASKDGRSWLSGVFAGLEGMGYQRAGADLCAAGVGQKNHPLIQHAQEVAKQLARRLPIGGRFLDDFAEWLGGIIVGPPHIRQRLFWVAQSKLQYIQPAIAHKEGPRNSSWGSSTRGLPHANGNGCDQAGISLATTGSDGAIGTREPNRLEHAEGDGRQPRRPEPEWGSVTSGCSNGGLGNPIVSRLERHAGHSDDGRQPGWINANTPRPVAATGRDFWSDFNLIPCGDGKTRRLKPGLVPLAHGIPGRVAQLRGLGNAICPQVAAEFIQAFLESE